MGDEGGTVSAEVGGWNVDSNSAGSAEALQETLNTTSAAPEEKEKPDVSEAASELGKEGGKASAKKRKTEAKEAEKAEKEAKPEEKPEGDKQEAKPEEGKEEKPEGDEEKPEKEEKPARKPRSARERMLEATHKEAEAKRALREERERVAGLEARLQALEQGRGPAASPEGPDGRPRASEGQSETQGPGPKPDPESFDSYEEYLDARDEHNRQVWTENLRKEYNQGQEQVQQQQFAAAVDRTLGQAIETFREQVADKMDQFSDDVVALKAEFQLGEGEQATGENWIANELIFVPESAPALMTYFSEHPDELQRIATLSTPRAVSREMAKLEARLGGAATTGDGPEPEPEVSRASPPLTPVRGSAHVADTDGYRQGMTLDEYQKHWNSKVRPRLR